MMSYSEVQTKSEEDEDVDGEYSEGFVPLPPSRPRRLLPAHCYKPGCDLLLYLVLGVAVICCVALLVAFGVGIVGPYKDALRFIPTLCKVVHSNYTGHRERCSCGKKCVATYPCISNYVRYNITSKDPDTGASAVQSVLAELFETDFDLEWGKCSWRPSTCFEKRHYNDMEVRRYESQYGVLGRQFPCLRHPRHPADVFRVRRADPVLVTHLMVWPCIIILACIIGLVFTYRKFGCGLFMQACIACWTCRKLDQVHWRNGTIILNKL